MERIELKTSTATRVLLGFLVAMVVIPLAVVGKIIGAVVAVVLVAGFIALCVAMGKRRLILDERGVTAKGISSSKHVRWDEVDHYTFWSMDQNAAYAGGAGQGALAVLVATNRSPPFELGNLRATGTFRDLRRILELFQGNRRVKSKLIDCSRSPLSWSTRISRSRAVLRREERRVAEL